MRLVLFGLLVFVLATQPALAADVVTLVPAPGTKPIAFVPQTPQQLKAKAAAAATAYVKAQAAAQAANTTVVATHTAAAQAAYSVARSTADYQAGLKTATAKCAAAPQKCNEVEQALNAVGSSLDPQKGSDTFVLVPQSTSAAGTATPTSANSCDKTAFLSAKGTFSQLEKVCTAITKALASPEPLSGANLALPFGKPSLVGGSLVMALTATEDASKPNAPSWDIGYGATVAGSVFGKTASLFNANASVTQTSTDTVLLFKLDAPPGTNFAHISFDAGAIVDPNQRAGQSGTLGSINKSIVGPTFHVPLLGPLGFDIGSALGVAASGPYTYDLDDVGGAYASFSPSILLTATGRAGVNAWIAEAGIQGNTTLFSGNLQAFVASTLVRNNGKVVGVLAGTSVSGSVNAAKGDLGFYERFLFSPRRYYPVIKWDGFTTTVPQQAQWRYFTISAGAAPAGHT